MAGSVSDRVFITGAQRSGTTLLAKLLDAQPAVSMLSQPFPLLFIEVKRRFLESAGDGGILYPLEHLFCGPRPGMDAFTAFLASWRPDREELRAWFDRMRSYSGQYARFDEATVEDAIRQAGDTTSFAEAYAMLAKALSPREAAWFGSKETSCEEFVPALLAHGVRVLLVVRDPRDVLASLNHGRGREFAGGIKPTLFNVRSWRKSVATALAMEGAEGFAWCRYEDLVSSPAETASRITARLGPRFPQIDVQVTLTDADGMPWRGNSSHRMHATISAESVGTHRDLLPPETARFVEAATFPELRVLGYATTMSEREAEDALGSYREPYADVRAGLEEDAPSLANTRREIDRIQRLHQAPDDESVRWFLFRRAHERLREAMS